MSRLALTATPRASNPTTLSSDARLVAADNGLHIVALRQEHIDARPIIVANRLVETLREVRVSRKSLLAVRLTDGERPPRSLNRGRNLRG